VVCFVGATETVELRDSTETVELRERCGAGVPGLLGCAVYCVLD